MATTATAPPRTRAEERIEQLQETIETSLKHLEAELALGHTHGFLQVLEFYSRLTRYSFGNTLLIQAQCPHATYVAGFRKWESLGFHVRRGEKAIYIKAPTLKKLVDRETGEITKELTGFYPCPVFDVSQCLEYPQKQPPSWTHALPDTRDWAYEYLLLQITMGTIGVLVGEEPMPQGIHGMAWRDRIAINPRLSDSEKFLTLIHEACHNLAHFGPDRHDFLVDDREIQAESATFVLCHLRGIDHPFARDYILRWKGDVDRFRDNLAKIQDIVRQMLRLTGWGEEAQ